MHTSTSLLSLWYGYSRTSRSCCNSPQGHIWHLWMSEYSLWANVSKNSGVLVVTQLNQLPFRFFWSLTLLRIPKVNYLECLVQSFTSGWLVSPGSTSVYIPGTRSSSVGVWESGSPLPSSFTFKTKFNQLFKICPGKKEFSNFKLASLLFWSRSRQWPFTMLKLLHL